MWADEFTGEMFTLKRLFEGPATYAIDYYQREYAWTAQDVRALNTDLCDEFDEGYDPWPRRRRQQEPSSYFLGPCVYYEAKGKRRFLVDGQRRFTTSNIDERHRLHWQLVFDRGVWLITCPCPDQNHDNRLKQHELDSFQRAVADLQSAVDLGVAQSRVDELRQRMLRGRSLT